MKFTEISEPNLDQIGRFLEALTPLARKAMLSGWSGSNRI
jgi:hypothetical protein